MVSKKNWGILFKNPERLNSENKYRKLQYYWEKNQKMKTAE